MKQFVQDYLNFSKKERRGIFILCVLILLIAFLPKTYSYFTKPVVQNTQAFENEIAHLKIIEQDTAKQFYTNNYYKNDDNEYQPYQKPDYKNYEIKGELFYFDPNTISIADWKRLGVRDKTIATIQNYLSKGGKFYKPEDIAKIWGFFPNEVERLMPYVQIASINQENKNYYPASNNNETKTYDKKSYTPKIVDINSADSSAFIELPGIGNYLAKKIINYREKLGGFYSINQIAETYGLPDSTFQKIKPRLSLNNTTIKQLNINTATIDELKSHPYLKYNIAKLIINYKAQHGNYRAVTDIKNIMAIDEETYNKISPYLKIAD